MIETKDAYFINEERIKEIKRTLNKISILTDKGLKKGIYTISVYNLAPGTVMLYENHSFAKLEIFSELQITRNYIRSKIEKKIGASL